MDIQPPEPHEHNTREDPEKLSLPQKVTRAAFIGAMSSSVAFVLSCSRLDIENHTTPPIIIKSTEESDAPMDIDTHNLLDETPSGTNAGAIAGLPSMLYSIKGFKLTEYVAIKGEKIGSKPLKVYTSDTGLDVNIWLEKYEFDEWRSEVDGPHLLVKGTSPDFQLTCAQLSPNTQDLSNTDLPNKRTFSEKKKWRIGKVQVGDNKPIETSSYIRLEIHFDNHYDR